MAIIKGFIENTAKEVAAVMFYTGISGIVFTPKSDTDRYDADAAISELYDEIGHDLKLLNVQKFEQIINRSFQSIERV